MASTVGVEAGDLSKEGAMSIKIVDLAKTLGTHLLAALDSVAAPEKLHRIAVELNTKTPESARELMITLASKDELAKLFTDCTQLGDLLPALNGCCFLINQSLKRVLSKAVREKEYSSDLDDKFRQAAF